MMSLKKHQHSALGANVQFAQVTGRITLANGEDCGEVLFDHQERWGHKLRRLAGKALPFLLIGIVAASAMQEPSAQPGCDSALPVCTVAATVIVNGGQAIVTNRMTGAGTEPKYVAWGTGAGTAAASDTTLFTEASESRTSGTSSRVTTTVTNDTFQVVGAITVAGADKTITNFGLFDASTSGNLYFKSDFTGLALVIGDSITFTIKVKFT